MMKRLKINDFCSIRVDGPLYCLSDLYNVMDMRNDRAAPQHWALDRAGIRVRKNGLFQKAYPGPGPVVYQRGWFRKTYWASASVLVGYATSLTPVTERDVRAAVNMSIEKPEVRKPVRAKVTPSSLPIEQSPLTRDDLFVAPEVSGEQSGVVQDGSYRRVDPGYEAMIQRAERRAEPSRRTQPASRGTLGGSRSHVSSSRASHNDAMVAQMLLMNAVLNDEPSRSRSVDTDTCSTSRSYDTPSHHHYHTPSYDPSPSYDPGSPSDGGGSSGCD